MSRAAAAAALIIFVGLAAAAGAAGCALTPAAPLIAASPGLGDALVSARPPPSAQHCTCTSAAARRRRRARLTQPPPLLPPPQGTAELTGACALRLAGLGLDLGGAGGVAVVYLPPGVAPSAASVAAAAPLDFELLPDAAGGAWRLEAALPAGAPVAEAVLWCERCAAAAGGAPLLGAAAASARLAPAGGAAVVVLRGAALGAPRAAARALLQAATCAPEVPVDGAPRAFAACLPVNSVAAEFRMVSAAPPLVEPPKKGKRKPQTNQRNNQPTNQPTLRLGTSRPRPPPTARRSPRSRSRGASAPRAATSPSASPRAPA
jgi:hypothetical protein